MTGIFVHHEFPELDSVWGDFLMNQTHLEICSINRSDNGDRRITAMGHILIQWSQVHISLTISSLLIWPRGRTQNSFIREGSAPIRVQTLHTAFILLPFLTDWWFLFGIPSSAIEKWYPIYKATLFRTLKPGAKSKNVHDHKLRCSYFGGYKQCFSLFEYDSCQRQYRC